MLCSRLLSEIKRCCISSSWGLEKNPFAKIWWGVCTVSRQKGELLANFPAHTQFIPFAVSVKSLLCPQKAEEEALAQEQSRQRALDAERERVAEMQRRQQEQEQFTAFEEMIRRQDLEKERQRLLLEFATMTTPSPDTPLIPGIEAPSRLSPAVSQSPGDLPGGINHQFNCPAANAAPPSFDRSLKPGSVLSPGNNSELIFFSDTSRSGLQGI